MLKPEALAHAFALTVAVFYIFLFILNKIAPPFFQLFFNSQFLGADISSQVSRLSLTNFLGALLAISITSWIMGYLVAIIYNKYAK
jgi:hypothetical protein